MLQSETPSHRFLFQHDGIDYLTLCLDVTVYWIGSIFDRVNGLLRFYERSMDLIGQDLNFYHTESIRYDRRVTDDTVNLLPFWLHKPQAKRTMPMLFMSAASTADTASDKAFSFMALEYRSAGALRLVLPAGMFGEPATWMVELTQNLVKELDFVSGHAGYSLNWNEDGHLATLAEQELYHLSRRYPGIDLPSISATIRTASQGIKCANWLTLLGARWCEELGGVDGLRMALGTDILVHELQNGVIIQAGGVPEIGDVNRHRLLPRYHQVGRVLAPIRSLEHAGFIRRGRMYDDEATEEWLGRFDS